MLIHSKGKPFEVLELKIWWQGKEFLSVLNLSSFQRVDYTGQERDAYWK